MSMTPAFVRKLVDDAAIFPPGNAPLGDAVHEHLRMRGSSDLDEIVGPFVVDIERLPATIAFARDSADRVPLDISVVVRPPASVADLVSILDGQGSVDLVAVEVVVPQREQPGLDAALAEIGDALSSTQRTPMVWVELPWPAQRGQWSAALAALHRDGIGLKLRTGGLVADAFPSVDALAEAVTMAGEFGVPFKCTAGLHSAVRHVDPATGFTHHGFLNILVAAVRATQGGTEAEARAIIAVEDESILVQALQMTSESQVERARALFRSYGSCSVREPLDDLTGLGLLLA